MFIQANYGHIGVIVFFFSLALQHYHIYGDISWELIVGWWLARSGYNGVYPELIATLMWKRCLTAGWMMKETEIKDNGQNLWFGNIWEEKHPAIPAVSAPTGQYSHVLMVGALWQHLRHPSSGHWTSPSHSGYQGKYPALYLWNIHMEVGFPGHSKFPRMAEWACLGYGQQTFLHTVWNGKGLSMAMGHAIPSDMSHHFTSYLILSCYIPRIPRYQWEFQDPR